MNKTQSPVSKYKSNFLTNVVFEIDFSKLLEINSGSPPSKFQLKVQDKFPILNEIQGLGLEFQAKLDAEEFDVKKEKEVRWEFLNKEKTRKIIISSTHLIVEHIEYEGFTELLDDIKFALSNFLEIYSVKISRRTGLRYVNQIVIPTGNPFDWEGFLEENLFDYTKSISEKEVLRSMHLLEVKEEDALLRFQFGFFNREYPNPIARREFILDYDCFIVDERDIEESIKDLEKFHIIISRWFEKSIGNELRKFMGAQNGS